MRIKTPNCSDYKAIEEFIKLYQLPKVKPAKFLMAVTKLGINPEGDTMDQARLPILKKTLR